MMYLCLKAICRVDTSDIESIPRKGPLIIVTNHVNFLEVPLLYIFLLPRRLIGLTKVETWDNWFLRYLANLWKAIPVQRGMVDSSAFKASFRALQSRSIVAIAPEGTRSGDGKLRKGRAGVVTMAALSGAPLLPVAHFGGERVWKNLKSFRRTRFTIRVGQPIHIDRTHARTKFGREEALKEVMCRLAELLPDKYRGYYSTICST